MALYTDYRTIDTTVTDAAAINNSIKNILFTKKGSLPGKPEFGSKIHELLFNQMDHIISNILKNYITEALYRWEKRINVTNVVVKEVQEYNKVITTISYTYRDKGLNINEQISIGLTQ
jgi:phage baseplate assembly protein W